MTSHSPPESTKLPPCPECNGRATWAKSSFTINIKHKKGCKLEMLLDVYGPSVGMSTNIVSLCDAWRSLYYKYHPVADVTVRELKPGEAQQWVNESKDAMLADEQTTHGGGSDA